MTEMVTLSLPDEVIERAREAASRTGQEFQQVLSEWLQQAAKRDPAALIVPNVPYPIYTPFGNEAAVQPLLDALKRHQTGTDLVDKD